MKREPACNSENPICVAGRVNAATQREILPFKEIYLRPCKQHHDLWIAANDREKAREK